MMIMRFIIPTPRLSLYPCESQTCPVGCEYAVSTIGVLEVISRLKRTLALPFAAPYGFCVPECFIYLPTTAFFINFAITYPRIVVVPDCRDAAVKGPLRLLMLYRQFAWNTQSWCRAIREYKNSPQSLVVPDRGEFAIYWMSLTDSTYIPYVRIVEAPIQHCDAKVMLIIGCSKYFWHKMISTSNI